MIADRGSIANGKMVFRRRAAPTQLSTA